jgi:hypothetical protein
MAATILLFSLFNNNRLQPCNIAPGLLQLGGVFELTAFALKPKGKKGLLELGKPPELFLLVHIPNLRRFH